MQCANACMLGPNRHRRRGLADMISAPTQHATQHAKGKATGYAHGSWVWVRRGTHTPHALCAEAGTAGDGNGRQSSAHLHLHRSVHVRVRGTPAVQCSASISPKTTRCPRACHEQASSGTRLSAASTRRSRRTVSGRPTRAGARPGPGSPPPQHQHQSRVPCTRYRQLWRSTSNRLSSCPLRMTSACHPDAEILRGGGGGSSSWVRVVWVAHVGLAIHAAGSRLRAPTTCRVGPCSPQPKRCAHGGGNDLAATSRTVPSPSRPPPLKSAVLQGCAAGTTGTGTGTGPRECRYIQCVMAACTCAACAAARPLPLECVRALHQRAQAPGTC